MHPLEDFVPPPPKTKFLISFLSILKQGRIQLFKKGLVKVLIILSIVPSNANFLKEISIKSKYFKCSKQKIPLIVCKNISTLELQLQFFHSDILLYKNIFPFSLALHNFLLKFYILFKIEILTAKGSWGVFSCD